MTVNLDKPTIRAVEYYSSIFGKYIFRSWELRIPGRHPKRLHTWQQAMNELDFYYRMAAVERQAAGLIKEGIA